VAGTGVAVHQRLKHAGLAPARDSTSAAAKSGVASLVPASECFGACWYWRWRRHHTNHPLVSLLHFLIFKIKRKISLWSGWGLDLGAPGWVRTRRLHLGCWRLWLGSSSQSVSACHGPMQKPDSWFWIAKTRAKDAQFYSTGRLRCCTLSLAMDSLFFFKGCSVSCWLKRGLGNNLNLAYQLVLFDQGGMAASRWNSRTHLHAQTWFYPDPIFMGLSASSRDSQSSWMKTA
jgi:hypothetical protein